MLYRDVAETFLERARTGRTALGVHCSGMSPQLVELYGLAGVDFVILGTEVEPLDAGKMDDLLRAANAARTLPMVKIRRPEPDLVSDWLTFGASMVTVPHVTSGPQLERLIAASKFAPEGTRGQCPAARYTGYSTIDLDVSRELANSANTVIPMIEDREAMNRLDEIAAVKGYDIIEIGPFDLGLSLGQPGQGYNSPVVVEAVDAIVEAARKHGKAVMAPMWITSETDSASKVISWQIEQLVSRGVTLLYDTEVVLLTNYFRNLRPLRGIRVRSDEEAEALERAAAAEAEAEEAVEAPAKPARAARSSRKPVKTKSKGSGKARATASPTPRRRK